MSHPTFTDRINVFQFGAKGDNATDDTAAFLAAITYASANGKEVFVPEGIYILDNLTFSNLNNVRLTGAGWQSILKRKSSAGRLATITACDGLFFDNLAFDNNAAATFAGITAYDCHNVYLNTCRFFDNAPIPTGIGADRFAWVSSTLTTANPPARNLNIVNCSIEDLETVWTHNRGVTVMGNRFLRPVITCGTGWASVQDGCICEQVDISHNTFFEAFDQGGGGGRSRCGVYLCIENIGLNNCSVRDVKISHNDFFVETNAYQGSAIMVGNFSTVASAGCTWENISIENNNVFIKSTATSTSAAAIQVMTENAATWKFTNVRVVGNTAYTNGKLTDYAFILRNLRDSTVSHNKAFACTHGISLSGAVGAERCLIHNNTVSDVSTVGYAIISAGAGNNSLWANYFVGGIPATRYFNTLLASDYFSSDLWVLPKLTLESTAIFTAANLPASSVPYNNASQELVANASHISWNSTTRRMGLNVAAGSTVRLLEMKSVTGDPAYVRIDTTDANSPGALAGIEFLEAGVGRWTLLNYANSADEFHILNESTLTVLLISQLGNITATLGDLIIGAVGKGLKIKEGADARMGVATLIAGTAVVSNANITANTRIFLTSNADAGTPGFLRVSTRTIGVSFTINSSNAADTSTVAYLLIEPAP